MKILFLPVIFFSVSSLHAQYYYNDIIATAETNQQMQTWVANKVKMITATGFDANGVKASDFAEVKEIKDNGRTLKVTTRNSGDYSAYYNRYDEKGRLISTSDSTSSLVINSITYEYNTAGRIIQVKTILSDPSGGFEKKEVHSWLYNAAGMPEKMWRIVNNTDSLEIRFVPDEKGNPGEEIVYKWGAESSRIYYYFDETGRVSDIVRFNEKVKKLLPDMIFTYDDAGRIIQKITSTPGENYGWVTWVGYFIWRYIYNDKGLKTKEALFDKEQHLTGKIEYSYNFQ
ncbi:MAG TPA: RHS repeat domain-containing protein [Chitinophagaceae bacterium]|nr:RHS repeat domain-containing protein [Chitinophagaceae bacterium]